ncbi:MAG TPA: PilZ domain-containing protein [Pseudolabrys sp.]|jgi:hypothetical protein
MIREKRNARRQPLRYTAWLAVTAEQRHGCVVSDISDTGARIDVQDAKAIPDYFVLLLSSNGAARRFCRVMWRKPTQLGVKFAHSLAEAANATLVPQANADEQGVPEPAPEAAPVQADPAKAN